MYAAPPKADPVPRVRDEGIDPELGDDEAVDRAAGSAGYQHDKGR